MLWIMLPCVEHNKAHRFGYPSYLHMTNIFCHEILPPNPEFQMCFDAFTDNRITYQAFLAGNVT